jgi:predicted dehydrogenase
MNKSKVRVAIIGCGQISEAHIKEIQLINQTEVVAVCDILENLAHDLAVRNGIPGVYCDFNTMIKLEKPDVVHITTPPHTHLQISLDAIAGGCHVYIEKPFGLSYREATKIIEDAKAHEVIACAGFSQLYDYASKRWNLFFKGGNLGDVVHVETYYGNSLDGSFSRVFLQDENHWIHKLPGKLFQNIISHALYHITPFFRLPLDRLQCLAMDRSDNGKFFDELRVMLQSGKVTGYLTFTSAVQPVTQFVRIYGTKGIAEVDLANHAFRSFRTTQLPGPIARVCNLISAGKQSGSEGLRHARQMLSGNDRFFSGMGHLFTALYDTIRRGELTPPVEYAEVLKAAAIMDEIGRQYRELEVQLKGERFN